MPKNICSVMPLVDTKHWVKLSYHGNMDSNRNKKKFGATNIVKCWSLVDEHLSEPNPGKNKLEGLNSDKDRFLTL